MRMVVPMLIRMVVRMVLMAMHTVPMVVLMTMLAQAFFLLVVLMTVSLWLPSSVLLLIVVVWVGPHRVGRMLLRGYLLVQAATKRSQIFAQAARKIFVQKEKIFVQKRKIFIQDAMIFIPKEENFAQSPIMMTPKRTKVIQKKKYSYSR